MYMYVHMYVYICVNTHIHTYLYFIAIVELDFVAYCKCKRILKWLMPLYCGFMLNIIIC